MYMKVWFQQGATLRKTVFVLRLLCKLKKNKQGKLINTPSSYALGLKDIKTLKRSLTLNILDSNVFFSLTF